MSGYPLRWVWVPAGLGAFALLAERLDLDRALARLWFDPLTRDFPWRHAYLLDTVLHHWAKYLVAAIALGTAAAFAATFFVRGWRSRRRALGYVALGLMLAPAVVSAVKLASATPCPWDIAEFGGQVQYGVADPRSPGRCFPAGHASTGFALMAFYFAGVAHGRRRFARAALGVAVAAGAALGFGRMLQGAHFLSHTVWTGLVCWYVLLVLHAVLLHRPHGSAAVE